MQPRWVSKAVLAFAMVVSLTACDTARSQEAATRIPITGTAAPQIPKSVDRAVLDFLSHNKIPGATLAVTRNGRLVFSKAYGYANAETREAMQPTHRTWFGSTAKVLTTVGALQLAEADTLDLDGHVYASSVMPLWGAEPTARPGLSFTPDGVLDNVDDYLNALVTGILEDDDVDDLKAEVGEKLDWASRIRVRNLLTHTAGLLNSGSIPAAAAMFDKHEHDVTYPEVHQAMLAGRKTDREGNRVDPFIAEPGTTSTYSNHSFGLMGQVIAERSGMPYVDYMQQHVFHPLGLDHVVPVRTTAEPRDAFRHRPDGDGNPIPLDHEQRDKPPINVSTGGWAITSEDFVRVLCALDADTRHLRVLGHDAVEEMATVQFPQISSTRPLGWDLRSADGTLGKAGRVGGGGALVQKYPPGSLSGDEINIAMGANMSAALKDGEIRSVRPTGKLLGPIAQAIADAAIPEDYDLFEPEHACHVPRPTITIDAPSSGDEVEYGHWVDLEATAIDYWGEKLPVSWTSDRDGHITGPKADGAFTEKLSPGNHVITATAQDSLGQTAADRVTLIVRDPAPVVSILAPTDGATVPEHSALTLAGKAEYTLDFIPDEDVRWTIATPGGQRPVATASGRYATVPVGTLSPGEYVVTLSGTVGGVTATDRASITVTPADRAVIPVIISPENGTHRGVDRDGRALFRIVGHATDPSTGDELSGTKLRWTAISDEGTEVVLCAGSETPNRTSDGGGIGAVQSCSDAEAHLELEEDAISTHWVVTLAAYEGTELLGRSQPVGVTVQVMVR